MGSSIAPIHRGVSSLCYSFLYALLFSLPLCRRSTPPPLLLFFFFLSSKSLSSVTHNSTISTVELVLWSLALFSLSSYIFYLSSVPSNFSCPGFLFFFFFLINLILPHVLSPPCRIVFSHAVPLLCSPPPHPLTSVNINILGVCHRRYPGRVCHQNHFNANFPGICDK